MQFNEKRYANRMIDELNAKHKLAITHGGDVNYFNKLIDLWQIYLKRLTETK